LLQAFEFDIPVHEDMLPKRLWVGPGVVLLGVNPNSILAKIIEYPEEHVIHESLPTRIIAGKESQVSVGIDP